MVLLFSSFKLLLEDVAQTMLINLPVSDLADVNSNLGFIRRILPLLYPIEVSADGTLSGEMLDSVVFP